SLPPRRILPQSSGRLHEAHPHLVRARARVDRGRQRRDRAARRRRGAVAASQPAVAGTAAESLGARLGHRRRRRFEGSHLGDPSRRRFARGRRERDDALAAGVEPVLAGSARGRGGVDTTAAGVAAAARGNAAPAGPVDAHVLKFGPDGKFLLQIGTPGKTEGPDSQTTLNRPAAVAVDAAANEVYVADSGNHRIVVFNSENGAYKRHWGAYGEKPTAAGGGAYDPAAPPARQFRDVTCVELAKDGMVYVCDRTSNRIQVFQKDGKFVKEGIISKNTRGTTVTGQFGVVSSYGAVWDIAFSSDPQQQHIFVADGHDKKVLIVQRDTLTEVGSLGDGGRQPGRFLAVGSIATDSRGNLYTGEQHHGKRVQKFVPGARR